MNSIEDKRMIEMIEMMIKNIKLLEEGEDCLISLGFSEKEMYCKEWKEEENKFYFELYEIVCKNLKFD